MANVAKVPPVHEEEERAPRVVEQPARGPRGFFQQRPYAKWVLALAALMIVAGVVFVWHYYSVRESTDDAQIDGHIDPLSPRVSGTVLRVLHDDNEVVSAGELLVELDPKDYEVAVQRAQADLADAEANSTAAHTGIPLTSTTSTNQLAAADAGVIAAEREVEAANARVAEAQANHDRIETDLKRITTLVQHDEVSRQEYDTAVAAEKSAKAALDAARSTAAMSTSRVAQARAQAESSHTVPEQIKMTRARAGAASAEVERARASLAQAQLNLQYTKIYAPVSGILSKRSVEQGQVVQAGQPLFSLVNLDDLWVTANFKETQLREMHTGQKVKVRVDAYDRDYDAMVESVGGATGARFSLLPPENATGNYVKVVQRVPVRIRIDKGQDPQHVLRPGLSVEPTVFLK
ncbi:MAG TPA: HlyD family secretion protein [Candidatus Angelobacter sp.]|nr:HlyD family secretion protein [Candidatus Angelobacter sp.]